MIISGPGKPLEELAGQSGPIAILANGPSLPVPLERLEKIKIPTFGMNRTWLFPSTYFLALEPEWLDVRFEGQYFLNATTFIPRNLPVNYCRGWRVPLCYEKNYSEDIKEGFFPASTGYLALQVARALGYSPVYFLGLDLGGDHFSGGFTWEKTAVHQNFYFNIAKKHFGESEVLICGSPDSKCTAFPHCELSEVM